MAMAMAMTMAIFFSLIISFHIYLTYPRSRLLYTLVQIAIVILIAVNVATNNWLTTTTAGELIPTMIESNPFLASKALFWFVSIAVNLTGIIQTITNMSNVMIKLGPSEFFKIGFPGLVPLF